MKKITIFLLFFSQWVAGQSINNVNFYTSGEAIEITYDLVNTESRQVYDVSAYVRIDGGSCRGPLRYVEGDIESSVRGGYGKRITWQALNQYSSIDGNVAFKTKATCASGCNTVPEGMVLIEGGTFSMGSNEYDREKPIHQVMVNNFYMSKYEVTNAQYAEFLNAEGNQTEGGKTWLDIESKYCNIEKNGSRYVAKSGYANHPVIEVTWYGASAYCNWLSETKGGTYRLPSEAEWEYAARGGQSYKYAGSNDLNSVAWYGGNSGHKTHPVGKKSANGYGLYDMSGNVWEWCMDTWHSNYNGAPTNGQVWLGGDDSKRVLRGGSWYVYTNCRVADRGGIDSSYSNSYFGFRCIRVY